MLAAGRIYDMEEQAKMVDAATKNGEQLGAENA